MTGEGGRDAIADGGGSARRFFVPDAGAGATLTVRGDLAHRMLRVLRLQAGDAVELFDGNGRSRPARITEIERSAVHLAVGAARRHPPEPRTVLLAAMIRANRLEWLVEKSVELGVSAIRLVITERCTVRAGEIGAARRERWRRIAAEAAEQCGRVVVPPVEVPVPLSTALAAAEGAILLAAEPAHGLAPPLGQLLGEIASRPVTILTGPEGGLTANEVRAAERAGARPVSLGPRVLRAETAAIAALAILADTRSRSARSRSRESE